MIILGKNNLVAIKKKLFENLVLDVFTKMVWKMRLSIVITLVETHCFYFYVEYNRHDLAIQK
jgi:hypothetical protein